MNPNQITDEQDLNSTINEQSISSNENDLIFPSKEGNLEKFLQMKRYGKENKNETNQRGHRKNKHSKYSLDNVKIKLFVHFCNYIIQFINDYIRKIYGYQKRKLRKIKYDIKKNIFRNSLFNLMNMTIENFCKLDISNKYNKETEQNFLNFEKIKKYFDNDFINITLLEFYKSFYLETNPIKVEKIMNDFGLTNKTENFNRLCNKQNEKEMVIKFLKASKDFLNVKEKLNRKMNANKLKKEEIEKQDNILFTNDNIKNILFEGYMNSTY